MARTKQVSLQPFEASAVALALGNDARNNAKAGYHNTATHLYGLSARFWDSVGSTRATSNAEASRTLAIAEQAIADAQDVPVESCGKVFTILSAGALHQGQRKDCTHA